jgi:hypothetical protein
MARSRISRTLVLVALLLALGILVGWALTRSPGPAVLPLDAAPPADVTFREQGNEDADRTFIDDFAWREFVALSWPARDGKRGVPDLTRPFGAPTRPDPVVWETWKSVDELIPEHPDREAPTEWESFDAAASVGVTDGQPAVKYLGVPGLSPKGAGRRKVLGEVIQLRDVEDRKLEEIQQPGLGNMKNGPLVAQNGTFVRYEVRVNRVAYDFIRSNQYYRGEKLPGPGEPKLHFPEGATHIKAAWMELTDPDDDRFYRVRALVRDPMSGQFHDRTVGLVGLHIVQRTPNRRNWVWATFEHVDNTEPVNGAGPASFNSENPPAEWSAATHGKQDYKPGNPPPEPRNISRKTKLHPVTEAVNRRYHAHPEIKNTVWKNYRLVATQWPTHPGDGHLNDRLPPDDVANVTMETYSQNNSCIRCHRSADSVNLVFYPALRTAKPPGP